MVESQSEQGMHPRLKQLVLESARRDKAEKERVERESRALVLCGPDCPGVDPRRPGEHCHTYWDMLRCWEALDYGWKLRRAREAEEDMNRVDVVPHLRRAGVGQVHLDALRAPESKRPLMPALKRWLEQPRTAEGRMRHPWLALLGLTGAGKTQAAVLALAWFVRRHPWNSAAGGGTESRPFVLAHGSEVAALARQLRDFAAAAGARERESDWRRCRVLVLDDVGAERLDPDALSLLHSVADERYRTRRVTVWTGNLPLLELERRLDFAGGESDEQRGRLVRRLLELGHVAQVGKGGRVKLWVGGEEVAHG